MLVVVRLATPTALLLLSLGGCSDERRPGEAGAPRDAEPRAVVVGCDDHVEPPRPAGLPDAGVTLRWGAGQKLTIEPAGPPSKVRIGERVYWLWKAPVGLSAATQVHLSFGGKGRGQFFRSHTPESETDLRARAVITSCAADTPLFSGTGVVGERTGFAFGFVTDSRSCSGLELHARVEGQLRTSPLGEGSSCTPPPRKS